MIYDYYLKLLIESCKEDDVKSFKNWEKENEKRLRGNSNKQRYIMWQEEEIIGRKKKDIVNLKDKKVNDFYPSLDNLQNSPQSSTFIKISSALKKPYTSKDEGEFYLLEWTEKRRDEPQQKIIENPIVRDTFTGIPMVRPSTWKGHLRFTAEKVEWKNKDEKRKIIKRLFGSKPNNTEETLKGRLYFFPTFFKEKAERDVITPLKRDTRTPTEKGPIPLEVMKPGESGEFYLLYLPYPKDKDFNKEQIKEDLEFIAEALKLMFYTYGFSAKKTSGFGVIEKLGESDVKVYPEGRKHLFSILFHPRNNNEKA